MPGHGAEIDLYQVSRLVASQSAAERLDAVRSGLAEVLVRVSGRAATVDSRQVRAALAESGRYLLEYAYASTEEYLELPAVDGVAAEQVPALELSMRFQASVINELLRRSGEPILPTSRPAVLAWIALDDGSRRLFDAAATPEMVADFRQQAVRRGLRLMLPVLDLEETLLVGPETVWTYNDEPLDEASARYRADSVLVGRLFATSTGQWIGDWRYELAGEFYRGEGEGESAVDLLASMIDQVAEAQSARHAVFASPGESLALRLRIEAVERFDDYVAVSRYLQGLTAVRQVSVSLLDGDVAEFLVYTDAGIDSLRQEIALDTSLLAIGESDNGALSYRWRQR